MSRSLRFFGIALAAVAVVSFAGTAGACDSAAKAAKAEVVADNASTKAAGCASKTESVAKASSCASKTVDAAMASSKPAYCSATALAACASQAKMGDGCCATTAAKMANLSPFGFVNEAKEHDVAVGVQSTDDGFAFVFAGGTDETIASAKKIAGASVASMSKPAACDYTRGAMAKKAGGCEKTEACLSALASADIVMVETENGALAKISSKDEAKIKELHGFLQSFARSEEAPKDKVQG